jgi:hypothetical protein
MLGTRRPGKGQNIDIKENGHCFDMYANPPNDQQCIEHIYFWMKLSASRKCCPKSLQRSQNSKWSKIRVTKEKCCGTSVLHIHMHKRRCRMYLRSQWVSSCRVDLTCKAPLLSAVFASPIPFLRCPYTTNILLVYYYFHELEINTPWS